MKRSETMAPMVEVELDKTRHILLDIMALAKIEEKLPSVNTLKSEFWEAMSASRILVVLWAGLLHEDETLKLEDMRRVVGGRDLAPITKKLLEAYGLAKPEAKEEEEGADPQSPEANQNPSTSSTSGQSGDTN